jgi:hypothetical protein
MCTCYTLLLFFGWRIYAFIAENMAMVCFFFVL